MKPLLVVCCCLAISTFIGCKMAPPGTTPDGGDQEVTQEQLRLLEDIRTLQQQTGQTVQALMQDAQAREQRALAEQGLPTIVEDIAAAQGVLGDASEAAQLQRPEAAQVALDRLSTICVTMLTDLPARRIAMHCERALAYLHLPTPRLNEASAELTAAYDVCVSSADSARVQDMLSQAKGHLAASNTAGAGDVLRSIIAKTAAEPTARLLGRMLEGIAGARDALDRASWPVLQAELLEVRRMLDELSQTVHFTERISSVQPPATETASPATGEAATPTGESDTGTATPAAGATTAPSGEAVNPATPVTPSTTAPAAPSTAAPVMSAPTTGPAAPAPRGG